MGIATKFEKYMSKFTRIKYPVLSDEEKAGLNSFSEGDTALCSIYDRIKRQIIYRELPVSDIPDGSISYPFYGRNVHFLGVNEEGKYWPIFKNGHNREDFASSPLILTIATKKPEKFLPVIFKYSTSALEKIKIGILIVFSFAELVVLFLIVSVLSGGRI